VRLVDLAARLGPDLVDLSSRVGSSAVSFIASRSSRVVGRKVCLVDPASRGGTRMIHQPGRLSPSLLDLASGLGTSVSYLPLCLVPLDVCGGDLGGGLRSYLGQSPLQPGWGDFGVERID
jgi:hypothetical protein